MTEEGSILEQIIASQQATHREHFTPRATYLKLAELLSDRERQVLWRRFGLGGEEPETLEAIGHVFRITRERVRQIERLGVSRLCEKNQSQDLLKPIQQVVVELFEAEGGMVAADRLLKLLGDIADGASSNLLSFLMQELLSNVIVALGGENTPYHSGWRLRTAAVEALDALVGVAEESVSLKGVPMSEEDLAQILLNARLSTPLGEPLTDARMAVELLALSRSVKRNAFGEWGLSHWETVTPKRMNDKIYLVLKKHGKPMHFRELVERINQQAFDHKKAYAPTVHNELILDKKFVLVGRGIYALREWGYAPGVVADVIVLILQERGPLDREAIVREVLKQRMVKKGTVYLALTNRQKFEHLSNGTYTLTQTTNNLST